MSIRKWPASERPREKLLQRGAEVLSDAELLAIFIHSGIPGKTALDLARDLLRDFGTLRKLLNTDVDRFCRLPGLGKVKYAYLQASQELARRYFAETMQRQNFLDSPDSARQFLRAKLRDKKRELFSCIFLDNRHRVVEYRELFQGTINGASVYPREIVRIGLELNAAAVVAAHNHPSGVAEPSGADERLTATLKQALALVEIRLLDHIIVGDGEAISMSERGLC